MMPPADAPKRKALPQIQKVIAATRTVTSFVVAMSAAFFGRTRPASSAAKPPCMRRTRAAARKSQMIPL